MLTETECIAVFKELSQILNEEGLGWLMEAVAQEIDEGIIAEASVNDFKEDMFKPPPSAALVLAPAYRKSIKKAEFLVRREFTHSDQLRLLVDAVEEVVSQGSNIENDLVLFFKESGGPREFMFVDVRSSSAINPQGRQFDLRSSAVEGLHGLLQELREEIPR
jgi:hypothetical protein